MEKFLSASIEIEFFPSVSIEIEFCPSVSIEIEIFLFVFHRDRKFSICTETQRSAAVLSRNRSECEIEKLLSTML